MSPFLVVMEKANGNHSACSPDLPGCAATGSTMEDAEKRTHYAVELHVRGLIEDGLPVPVSRSIAEYVAIRENA